MTLPTSLNAGTIYSREFETRSIEADWRFDIDSPSFVLRSCPACLRHQATLKWPFDQFRRALLELAKLGMELRKKPAGRS